MFEMDQVKLHSKHYLLIELYRQLQGIKFKQNWEGNFKMSWFWHGMKRKPNQKFNSIDPPKIVTRKISIPTQI